MSKKLMKSVLAASVALIGISSGAAYAADGYGNDNGGTVVRNNYGECWRSGSWTKANATEDCDKDLLPPPAPKAEPAPAPAPVVELPKIAPTPAPAPAPAPAPRYEKLTYRAEALFAFGSSQLSPKGKAELKEFADKFKADKATRTDDPIKVVGHTDRIGKPASNQKLSEARADAVKAFAVQQGLDANGIVTEGKGETEPVTKDCKGTKKTKKLVECLAPDRRVEIFIPAKKQIQ